MELTISEALQKKWQPILEHADLPQIKDPYRKAVTTMLLENQEQYLREAAPTNFSGAAIGGQEAGGNVARWDPILISLVRRAMPNLIAYDICGVQPMSGPTGLIFAMRARYDEPAGFEANFDEPMPSFSGNAGTTSGITSTALFSSTGVTAIRSTVWDSNFRGMLTGKGETLGQSGSQTFKDMAFSIERIAVEARTRALKAEYTTELAQDLKAVHGLDAEAELSNILSTEILNEINREIIRCVYTVAKTGAQQADLYHGGAPGGVYDLLQDSDGRWSAERFRGLMFQIEREANVIAKETRRGKGNFIICSADVASALAMGGFLNLSPALNVNLNADDTGNIFAGVLNGKYKVYIDPFVPVGMDFALVGYKGSSAYDAGVFYCPYVPLQMVRAINQDTFQPKIGFKTRYGMVSNPFAKGRTAIAANADGLDANANCYYRLFQIKNLHGMTS